MYLGTFSHTSYGLWHITPFITTLNHRRLAPLSTALCHAEIGAMITDRPLQFSQWLENPGSRCARPAYTLLDKSIRGHG
jgi:hypothetical protein